MCKSNDRNLRRRKGGGGDRTTNSRRKRGEEGKTLGGDSQGNSWNMILRLLYREGGLIQINISGTEGEPQNEWGGKEKKKKKKLSGPPRRLDVRKTDRGGKEAGIEDCVASVKIK